MEKEKETAVHWSPCEDIINCFHLGSDKSLSLSKCLLNK